MEIIGTVQSKNTEQSLGFVDGKSTAKTQGSVHFTIAGDDNDGRTGGFGLNSLTSEDLQGLTPGDRVIISIRRAE